MQRISRRTFVKQAAGAAMVLSGGITPQVASAKPTATDMVTLGKSGIKVPRIAMGTGSHGWNKQSQQTQLGQKTFTSLMEHGCASGIPFIDAADIYGSYPMIKEALKSLPRDKVTLLGKVWFANSQEIPYSTSVIPHVDRLRKETGTEMIDIVLLHCTTDSNWPEQLKQMRDELSELKQKGIVRVVGTSCHSHAALKAAVEHPWVDMVLARINNQHVRMDDDATVDETAQLLKKARANGKGVLGMKIFGCGDLTEPEQRDASLKYVLGNGLVDAMTIGFASPDQVDDTLQNVNRVLAG